MARLRIDIDTANATANVVKLDKELDSFTRSLDAVERETRSFTRNAKSEFADFRKSVTSSLDIKGFLIGAFAVNEIANVVSSLKEISDTYTLVDARIKNVTSSQEEFNSMYGRLYELSKDTYSEMDVNTQAFSKLAYAMEDVSRSDIVDYLDTVNKSLKVGGAGVQESASFMLQWAQAMGSGVVAGDELKSMIESNSYLMPLLAKELGTTTSGLKKMGSEGSLSAELFASTLEKVAATVNKDFTSIPPTIEGALSTLGTVWESIIADAGRASDGSRTVADAILELANTAEAHREDIESVLVGLVDMIPSAVKGVGEIAEQLISLSSIAGGIMELGGPNAAEWGIIGVLLFKGKTGYAGILGALFTLNDALEHYGMNIGSIPQKWKDSSNAVQQFFDAVSDVATGKRDWWTGEFVGLYDELEKTLSDLSTLDTDIDVDVNTDGAVMSLDKLQKKQQQLAESWLKESGKSAERSIEKYQTEIDRMSEDISKTSIQFSSEVQKAFREGMTDSDAWDDLNAQVKQYWELASNAASAGNWKEQEQYLTQIKTLLGEMPDKVTEVVTAADVTRAKQIYEYQLRITQGGKGAWGTAADDLERARQNFAQAQQDFARGYKVVVTEEESRKQVAEQLKEVNEEILRNKEAQRDQTKQEKEDLEAVLTRYKTLAGEADGATTGLSDSVSDVGVAWTQVGDDWQNVATGMVADVQDVIASLDEAIAKMNQLDASSGSSLPGRAIGGSVTAGRSYVVGENGPEIFTPSGSGYIVPNSVTSRAGSEDVVRLDLNINGKSMQLQGSPMDVAAFQRAMDEIARYAS